jgi:flagellar basal body-associated protein FliL
MAEEKPQEPQMDEKAETKVAVKSKLSFKTLILIGMPLVLVQVALAYFVVSSYIQPHLPENKPKPEEKKAQEVKGASEADLSKFKTYEIKDIIVNPAETSGQRYLSVAVDIYILPEVEPMIKNIEPEIRNLIIERISRKRMDELDNFKAQQILRDEIKDDINSMISKYFSSVFLNFRVPRVVFSSYTIQ